MTAHIVRLMLLAFTCRLSPHLYLDPYKALVLLVLRIFCTPLFAFIILVVLLYLLIIVVLI